MVSAFLASSAYAQFGGLLSGGGGGGGASPESIVKSYVGGAKDVLGAQGKLLEALGKKDEAAKAALQANNLTEGATKQNLEDATKTQTDNSKLLEASLKEQNTALDGAAKVVYAQGLGLLGRGTVKYIALTNDAKSFKPGISSIGAAAQSAVYIVQSLPGNMTNFSSTLKSAIEFGKAQGVEIPADATAALK
jgi:hypothetical protein